MSPKLPLTSPFTSPGPRALQVELGLAKPPLQLSDNPSATTTAVSNEESFPDPISDENWERKLEHSLGLDRSVTSFSGEGISAS